MRVKIEIMDEMAIKRALIRISHEISERNKNLDDVVLVGILQRGALLASHIASNIVKTENKVLPVGEIDISIYRNNYTENLEFGRLMHSSVPFSINDKVVVLVDDVVYTGRSLYAGVNMLYDLGVPRAIQTAVLVDREGRELPIGADYAGKHISLSKNELVSVNLDAKDGRTNVEVYTIID